MPDIAIKEKSIGDYYILMEEQVRYNNYIYYVCICPKKGEHFAGYPVNKMTYNLSEKKLAEKTFYRYCRKAKEWSGLI